MYIERRECNNFLARVFLTRGVEITVHFNLRICFLGNDSFTLSVNKTTQFARVNWLVETEETSTFLPTYLRGKV